MMTPPLSISARPRLDPHRADLGHGLDCSQRALGVYWRRAVHDARLVGRRGRDAPEHDRVPAPLEDVLEAHARRGEPPLGALDALRILYVVPEGHRDLVADEDRVQRAAARGGGDEVDLPGVHADALAAQALERRVAFVVGIAAGQPAAPARRRARPGRDSVRGGRPWGADSSPLSRRKARRRAAQRRASARRRPGPARSPASACSTLGGRASRLRASSASASSARRSGSSRSAARVGPPCRAGRGRGAGRRRPRARAWRGGRMRARARDRGDVRRGDVAERRERVVRVRGGSLDVLEPPPRRRCLVAAAQRGVSASASRTTCGPA